MKKLFIFLLLFGCVTLQVKDTFKINLPEIEGVELKSFREWIGEDLETVRSWEVAQPPYSEGTTDEMRGLSREHKYFVETYFVPDSSGTAVVSLISIEVDGEPIRVERVGCFMYHQMVMQYVMVACYDRYKDTDKWYAFDADLFDEQHNKKPLKSCPNRMKRNDSI